MANVNDPAHQPSLGIGGILSSSFSILFSRFFLLFAISFAVQLIFILVTAFFFSDPERFARIAQEGVTTGVIVAGIASFLVAMLGGALTTGVVVLAAYDARLGNPARVGAYFGATLNAIIPLVILSIAFSIGVGIFFMLLIIPGIWLYARWAVYTPAIVAEGAGFGGLSRSAELTKEYRWPIVGLLVLVIIMTVAVSQLMNVAISAVMGVSGLPPAEQFAASMSLPILLVNGIVGAITAAFTGVVIAVLYARLKEIKEGVGFEDLANVFE